MTLLIMFFHLCYEQYLASITQLGRNMVFDKFSAVCNILVTHCSEGIWRICTSKMSTAQTSCISIFKKKEEVMSLVLCELTTSSWSSDHLQAKPCWTATQHFSYWIGTPNSFRLLICTLRRCTTQLFIWDLLVLGRQSFWFSGSPTTNFYKKFAKHQMRMHQIKKVFYVQVDSESLWKSSTLFRPSFVFETSCLCCRLRVIPKYTCTRPVGFSAPTLQALIINNS